MSETLVTWWETIPAYHGHYEACSDGRIANCKTKRVLRQKTHKRGYLVVTIAIAGKKTTRKVHQLILETFVGTRPENMEAAHLNGIKTDNRLCNLMWCTHKENESHKIKHGTSAIGSRSKKVYTGPVFSRVISAARNGQSYRQIGFENQLHHSTVSRIVRRSLNTN